MKILVIVYCNGNVTSSSVDFDSLIEAETAIDQIKKYDKRTTMSTRVDVVRLYDEKES